MKRSKCSLGTARLKVSADGRGVVSRAGVGMLREIGELTGLCVGVSSVLADTYRGRWVHDPGRVFGDLAAAVADGADCVSGIGGLLDQRAQHGSVASVTTTWRLLDQRLDADHLVGVKTARADARAVAWAAGAAPKAGVPLVIDVDATITIDHSDRKELAASTWKRTFGFHPLLAFLDRPEIAGGEALAGKLRPGNAGSNTTADHVEVLTEALASLPPGYRPQLAGSAEPGSPEVLVRSDSAGATHGFATACRDMGVGFSFGFPVTAAIRAAIGRLNDAALMYGRDGYTVWYPAVQTDGGERGGAWIAEATHLVDLSGWPAGTRLILRKERPHPGAQLTFTDVDGHRVTGFITDTPIGVVPGQLAGLDLRHRQHARVEDRIRQAKAMGLRGFPLHSFAGNAGWLEIVMTAIDLVAWAKLIGFTDHPDLARCEIDTFRYRVLHIAARLTRGARQARLRLDTNWRWAAAITTGWHQIRAAFT